MGSGMLVAMGIYHLAIFVFAVLGIAASIKISALLICLGHRNTLRSTRPVQSEGD